MESNSSLQLLVDQIQMIRKSISKRPKCTPRGLSQAVSMCQVQACSHFFGQLWINGAYECGCSLIKEDVILLAAHCIADIQYKSDMRVVLGSTELGTGMIIEVGNTPEFRRIHPYYITDYFFYDVALLKLTTRAHLSHRVQTISLFPGKVLYDQMVTVIGFGEVKHTFGRTISPQLRMTMLPVRYEKDCRIRDYQKYFDDVSQFCAGFNATVGIGLCSGDSGGPAFIHVFGKWQQVGVASWVNYCGFPGEYTYFAKIQEFRQWIVEESNKLSIY